MKKSKFQFASKVTLAELNKMEDITNMNILSFAPTCLLGIVNIVTWLTWLLN